MTISSFKELEGSFKGKVKGEFELCYLNGVLLFRGKEGEWENIGYALENDWEHDTDEVNVFWKDTSSSNGNAKAQMPQTTRVKILNRNENEFVSSTAPKSLDYGNLIRK